MLRGAYSLPSCSHPLLELTGEGKETVPETRDEMINIRKSYLDGELERIQL
jgi:hypothetical protein